MPFRITPQSIMRRSLFDMTNSYGRLADAQIDISSTKRLRVFSDHAADSARALDLRNTLQRTIQSRASIDDASRAADSQAELLEEVSALIAQARQLGESGAVDSKTPADLKSIATEIDSILEQIVGMGNQQVDGRYTFSGSRIDTRPFTVNRSFGKIVGVSYQGDEVVRQVRLGPGDFKEIELSGRRAFLDVERAATLLVGGTGLKPTQGASDTMVGTARLWIEHTSTVIGDGALGGGDSVSGIALGTSTANDTIIGPAGAHRITIASDGAGGRTIRLDDGEAIPFAGNETDLRVENGSGDAVHLNLTGVGASFTGDVDLTGNGTIAVDGGPTQALTFTPDYLLQDGSGRAMHLDTTSLVRGGETFVTFPGTESVFDVLIGLRNELQLTTGLDPNERVARIQARLGALDEAHDGVLDGLSTLGAKSASFQRVSSSLEFFELSLDEKRGELEDTDLFAATIQLSESENAYQAALQAAAKLLAGPTLLNFL